MPVTTKFFVKLLTFIYLILHIGRVNSSTKFNNNIKVNGRREDNLPAKLQNLRTVETSEKLSVEDSDFGVNKRQLQYNISRSTGCNVMINDLVQFTKDSDVNYVEHWILHNNVDEIEPKTVTSKDVIVKFFNFNKKMNTFIVYFDFIEEKKNQQFFSINFTYEAISLIKTFNYYSIDKDKDTFFLDEKSQNQDQLFNYNNFLWKIYNKNFIGKDLETLSIQINFDLGPGFSKYTIFSENPKIQFKKKIINNADSPLVVYTWDGAMNSQDVLVIDIKFPLYFESCKNDYMSITIVLIGSIFILFVILMLYVVFNSVMFNEL